MSDECHELKTIKYKSMLLNNNAEEKEETVENLSNMENLKVISDEETKITSGRVGIRAVSLDHMPIVGKKDGIYINTCHGSRASVTAPICAEIISSLITQKAPPLEKREMLSLSPGRFN